MSQIFHRSTNTLAKVSIFGALFLVGGGLLVVGGLFQSPWITQHQVVRDQPVPFSHEHHVRGLGIDCRYCHTGVETSSFAGIPSTKTCMTCHSQIWTNADVLEPVREAFRTGKPIPWTRVHNLPDYVFFDHSIHVAKGVACVTCHGAVDKMPLMFQQNTLFMSWCLECHRHPEKFVGPKEMVFSTSGLSEKMDFNGNELVRHYHIKGAVKLTDCYTCHR